MRYPTDDEFDKLTRAIAVEGINQGKDGWAAIAWAMKNRMLRAGQKPEYGDNLAFTMDHAGLEGVHDPSPQQKALLAMPRTDPRYLAIRPIAEGVFNNTIPDNTFGSTNFWSPGAQAAKGRKPPGWGRTNSVPLKQHVFNLAGPLTKEEMERDDNELVSGAGQPPISNDEFQKDNAELAGGSLPTKGKSTATAVGAERARPQADVTALGAGLRGTPGGTDWTEAFPKEVGTAAIHFLAHAGGAAGDIYKQAIPMGQAAYDYLTSKDPKASFAKSYQDYANRQPSGMVGRALNQLPSSQEIIDKVLGREGGYQPEGWLGRMGMSAAEGAGSALGMMPFEGAAATIPALRFLAGGLRPSSVMGGAIQGGTAQGVTDLTGSPVVGAAAGLASPLAVGRLTGAWRRAGRDADVLSTAAEHGVDVDADDVAGTRSLLSRVFGGGYRTQDQLDQWHSALMREVGGDRFGAAPSRITKDVIEGAKSRTWREASAVVDQHNMLPWDGSPEDISMRLLMANARNHPDNAMRPVYRALQRDLDSNGGQLSTKGFNELTAPDSTLMRLYRQGTQVSGDAGDQAMQFRQLLYERWRATASPEDYQAFREALNQRKGLNIIEQSRGRDVGQIDPDRLRANVDATGETPHYSPTRLGQLADLGTVLTRNAEREAATSGLTPAKIAAAVVAGEGGVHAASHLFPILESLTSPQTAAAMITAGALPGLRGATSAYMRDPYVVQRMLSGDLAPNTFGIGGAAAAVPQAGLPGSAGGDPRRAPITPGYIDVRDLELPQ